MFDPRGATQKPHALRGLTTQLREFETHQPTQNDQLQPVTVPPTIQ